MAYEEINPPTWIYTIEGDSIEGILLDKQENVGPNDAMLYSLETSEGVKNVWGATILDQRMAFVKVGVKLKITYKGLGEKKPGQNAPKIFKVEVDNGLEEEVPVERPEVNQPQPQ